MKLLSTADIKFHHYQDSSTDFPWKSIRVIIDSMDFPFQELSEMKLISCRFTFYTQNNLIKVNWKSLYPKKALFLSNQSKRLEEVRKSIAITSNINQLLIEVMFTS